MTRLCLWKGFLVVGLFVLFGALPAAAQVSILVDASRDGGVWWSPQAGPFDPNLPHQGKALADFLRGQGMQVTELPRPSTITCELLSQYHLVIAVDWCGVYSASELTAYTGYVSNGGRLILLTDHRQNCDIDTLPMNFGVDFSGALFGSITQFTPHPITAGVTSLPFLAGAGVVMAPAAATMLGFLSSTPVMGITPFGSGQIFFMGDTNGIEEVPQPFVNNLFGFMLTGAQPVNACAPIVVSTLADSADSPFDTGAGTVDDLPGADGLISLREAIIAANNTAGSQTITFDPSLSEGTININFDGLDANTDPDPLPSLSGGGTTINGDLNGDNVPDIILDGTARLAGANGIVIISSNNTINGLKLQNFPLRGIVVFAFSSTISNNTISNNIVSGGSGSIIAASAGSGSLLSNTTITGNAVSGAAFDSIVIVVERVGTGNTSISNMTITNNEVFSNTESGILAISFGQNNSITGLVIDNNNVHDNGFGGIGIASGVCGGTQNTMEATISRNILRRNGPADGTSGIVALGGSNFGCPGNLPLASQNQLTVTITGNILMDELGSGIAVGGGQIGAEQNTVIATVTDNTVLNSGRFGIGVVGGVGSYRTFSGPADNNTVTATVSGNQVKNSALAGIGLVGGSSGPADSNTIDAQVEENTACGNSGADIHGVGGYLGDAIRPPTTGTGNQVAGSLTNNIASTILVEDGVLGNTASLQQQGNRDCSATPAGTNVAVYPIDTTTGQAPVTLIFANVTQAGVTSLTTSSAGPEPPTGFSLGDPPTYYELSTTALFSGLITVCIDYSGISFSDESQLGLFHFEGGTWVDRTISLDTTTNIICASVDTLSPFAIFEPTRVVVSIDIQPGSFPNSINPKSRGVIPVAILTTKTFDATTVDPLSVEFGPKGAMEVHGRGHIKDVDGDSDLDLVLHFNTQDTGIVCGDTSASLTGETVGGQAITGADSIQTVGCQ